MAATDSDEEEEEIGSDDHNNDKKKEEEKIYLEGIKHLGSRHGYIVRDLDWIADNTTTLLLNEARVLLSYQHMKQ